MDPNNQPNQPPPGQAPQQPQLTGTPQGTPHPQQYIGVTGRLPDTMVTGKPPKESSSSIFSTIAILVAAPIVAVLLTMFVFQSYEVDGPSMEATLENRDRLIVLKLPRTISKITRKPYIPNRYDIIIFNTNQVHILGDGEKTQLIKRVIALPGERIVVKDGSVTVYNTEHPDGFAPDYDTNYADNLPGTTTGNVDTIVGQNEVFVLGDNRVNSTDSRIIGAIPAQDIVGKLSLRMFPIRDAQIF